MYDFHHDNDLLSTFDENCGGDDDYDLYLDCFHNGFDDENNFSHVGGGDYGYGHDYYDGFLNVCYDDFSYLILNDHYDDCFYDVHAHSFHFKNDGYYDGDDDCGDGYLNDDDCYLNGGDGYLNGGDSYLNDEHHNDSFNDFHSIHATHVNFHDGFNHHIPFNYENHILHLFLMIYYLHDYWFIVNDFHNFFQNS